MARLQDLVSFLDSHLEVARQPDFCPNGVQVEGAPEVSKIVTGVTACRELFEAAATRGAQLVLVHHGIFWNGWQPRIQGLMGRRIRFLLENDLTLLGYHLPLDRHPVDGNNAQIADRFGLGQRAGFAPYKGDPVGLVGELPAPMAAADFAAKVDEVFGAPAMKFLGGPEAVSRVALLSGKGDHDIDAAMAVGADAYITGEAGVSTREHAREGGIHFFAAGHHRTERWGVQAVGDRLAAEFGVTHEYVEVENPV